MCVHICMCLLQIQRERNCQQTEVEHEMLCRLQQQQSMYWQRKEHDRDEIVQLKVHLMNPKLTCHETMNRQ